MGNVPSSPARETPYRLSKPKTNTNGSFSSPRIVVPDSALSSPSRSEIEVDEEGNASVDGDVISRQDVREHLRYRIFGSAESSEGTSEDDQEDGLTELAGHVRDRLSRSGSLLSPTSNASTTKLTSTNASKLSLSVETRHIDLDATITILQEIKKSASPEDLAALKQALLSTSATELATTPASPLKDRSSALMRRRSLATPGLATRGAGGDALRKHESAAQEPTEASDDQTWRLEMFGTSPLARLATMDLSEGERRFSGPRAATPNERAYSHLGALKLGSLMITNGTASPVPGSRSRMTTPCPAAPTLDEDYFTASEGPSSPSRDLRSDSRLALRTCHSTISLTSTASQVTLSTIQPPRPETPRSASLLKFEHLANGSTSSLPRPCVRSSQSMAQEYMSELPSGPFEVEESTDFRAQAFRILEGSALAEDFKTDLTLSPSLRGRNSVEVQARPRPPAKVEVDSGYSSAASLKEVQSLNLSETSVSTLPESFPSAETSREKALTLRNQGPLGDTMITPQSSPQIEQPPSAKQSRFPLRQSKSWKSLQRPSTANPSPKSGSASLPASPARETAPQRQRKLQKARPASQTPICVQSCRPIRAGSIPDVPGELSSTFSRRLVELPAMECLDRTYASVEHTEPNKEEEFETFNVDIRFPSPSPPAEKTIRKPRAESEPPAPPLHIQSVSRSSRSVHRKAAQPREEPDETEWAGISDFGTVARSLGGSPYDIAIASLKVKPMVASPTHPHQLGTSLRSPKPRVGMDEAAASELARQRNAERAAAEARAEAARVEAACVAAARRPRTARPRSAYTHSAYTHSAYTHSDARASEPWPPNFSRLHSANSDAPLVHESRSGADMPPPPPPRNPERERRSRESAPPNWSEDWTAPSQVWRQHRRSIGESLGEEWANGEDITRNVSRASRPRYYAANGASSRRRATMAAP